jgi:hypothetical protein
VGDRGGMEREDEYECDRCTLYTCMKREHWNLSKSFKLGGNSMRETDSGDEPNQGTLYAYMELSQQNPLYN